MSQPYRLTFLILLGFFLIGTVLAFHGVAAAERIRFSIQDATAAPNFKESADFITCTEPNAFLDIAGTYTVSVGGSNETIVISRIDGAVAARIICDEANDMLILKNVKITTSTAPATNIKIK